ncbi:MAG: transglutaminase family protein [Chthoniobacterales bacterium]
MRKARANRNQGRGTPAAPAKSTSKRIALVAVIVAVVVVSIFAANSLRLHRQAAVNKSRNEVASALSAKAPRALSELLALRPDELEGTDIALMNLLCAEGLPGTEDLKVDGCLATLDQWAQHAKREIDRNYHHFREDPAYYHHSEAFYKMLMLAVVVYEDFGIRYNPKWIAPPSEIRGGDHFFADSRDILIHGMIGPQRMGTCSSMPVLYIALGRRLGYPLKLVTTKQHLFMRWDSPTERFNMDATGKGLDKYDDEYYKKWPFPITEQEIKEQDYLKSLSSREELSVLLSIRSACLTEAGRLAEATASFEAAYRRAPNWTGNQVMLAEAQRRQQGLPPAQRVLLRQEMNRMRPVNPLEPDPMRQIPNPWNHAQSPNPAFPPDPNPLSQIQNPTRTP